MPIGDETPPKGCLIDAPVQYRPDTRAGSPETDTVRVSDLDETFGARHFNSATGLRCAPTLPL
jgi:hypothetical protein